MVSGSSTLSHSRLQAHEGLDAPMLRVPDGTSGYTIRNLWFDGNRPNRLLYGNCEEDTYELRTHGYNLQIRGEQFLIENVNSGSALCGSAMEVDGSDYTIRCNNIIANGYEGGACRRRVV